MASAEKLRKQAAKARRLAAGLSDQKAKEALMGYAEEAEARADTVEAGDARPIRRMDET